MFHKIKTFGTAWGMGGADHGCADGPSVIQQLKLPLDWQAVLQLSENPDVTAAIAEGCERLASLIKHDERFLVIGGDHTCAIGTWRTPNPLGLIWIDAHMDSHTPETTESGHLYGMPLACLLGYGDPRLVRTPPLSPKSVVLIGVRSFEKGEAELLQRLGVRIFYMPEIKQRGLDAVMQEAIRIVSQNSQAYGLSIDLDAIDPLEAPGVGAPEPNGLSATELCHALRQLNSDPRWIGAEIAEFNPHRDKEQKTERIISELISALFR